jgi:hypothetical protein
MSLSCGSTNPGGNTESGRVQIKEDLQIRCGYKGTANSFPPLEVPCGPVIKPIVPGVPESTYLANKMIAGANCKITVVRNLATTSHQNTIDKQKNTIDCSKSLFNADTRFSKFYRSIPAPCPPIPPEYINATQSKPSFNNCLPPTRL